MANRSELEELIRPDTPVHTRTVGSQSTTCRKGMWTFRLSGVVVIAYNNDPNGSRHTYKRGTCRAVSNKSWVSSWKTPPRYKAGVI